MINAKEAREMAKNYNETVQKLNDYQVQKWLDDYVTPRIISTANQGNNVCAMVYTNAAFNNLECAIHIAKRKLEDAGYNVEFGRDMVTISW